jgi:hypothetical protein
MLLHNSWLLHLRAVKESDLANKNFGAFINTMEVTKNSKNDKIISLTEDPNSIVTLADNLAGQVHPQLQNIWGHPQQHSFDSGRPHRPWPPGN